MADVDDASNVSGKLENEWQLLEAAATNPDDEEAVAEMKRQWDSPLSSSRKRILTEHVITDDEYAAIQDFVSHRRDLENRATTTLINDLGNLRRAAAWTDTPLVEMTRRDVQDLVRFLTKPKDRGGRGLDPDGMAAYGYKRVLRVFFEFMHEAREYNDYGFWEGIELPSSDIQEVEEEKVLDHEEFAELKEAAMNPRDKALMEFLVDVGGRVTLAAQLRREDIKDLDTDEPYFVPNEDGEAQKDAPIREYPILQSRAELRSYVNRHHIDKRPEAPLWHLDSRWYDYDNPREGAMSTDRMRDMLKECMDRAGIEGRVHPHMFRHTAMTRLSNSERLTPQEIQHIAGWASDDMLEAYDQTGAGERNASIQTAAGYSEPETTEDGAILEPQPCGNCRQTVAPHHQFCPNCGMGVTEDARELKSEAVSDVATGMTEVEEMSDREFRAFVIERLEDDPSALTHGESPPEESSSSD